MFYLGTHEVSWLEKTAVPLCVSRRRLAARKTLPRALGPWMLDSGGFSELSLYGGWVTPPAQYAAEVRRFRDEVGNLAAAACQDWMCEPVMLARTGQSVRRHQARTVTSVLRLRDLAPDLPWFPVLQGWEPADYLRHVEAYGRAGIDLAAEPIVGVGSVCRRQGTAALAAVADALIGAGFRLHGFGVKEKGLVRVMDGFASADSLAWSYNARRRPALPGCSHRNCSSCLRYALWWRERLLGRMNPRGQLRFEWN